MEFKMSIARSRTVLVAAAVIILPSISWGRLPWLTAVFALLVTAAFLIEMRERFTADSFSFSPNTLWIPFFLLYGLTLYHLALTPVPYTSILFLCQITVGFVFFHLLTVREQGLSTKTVVLIWMIVLLPWTFAGVLFAGARSAGGPFVNLNYLATVILSCMAYLAGSDLDADEHDGKSILFLVVASVCTVGLLALGSRSAAIGTVLVWSVILVKGRRRSRLVAAVVLAAIFILPSTLQNRVVEVSRKDPHAFTRIQIWEGALKMGLDHPLTGVGPKMFQEYAPVYAFPVEKLPVRYGRIARKPHNEYLRSWAEGGGIGVVVMGIFLIMTLRYGILAIRKGRAGPALATGTILLQAAFHDVSETFAILVLAVWWLALLTRDPDGNVEGVRKNSRLLYLSVLAFLIAATFWINMDVASRILWLKGQRLMTKQPAVSEQYLERSRIMNPLFPGTARDLGRIKLQRFRKRGDQESWQEAEAAIQRAISLNRRDSVPLRLYSALFVAAADRTGSRQQALAKALFLLEKAQELEPNNALIMLNSAEIKWDLALKREALGLVEEALSTEPNYLEAHRKKVSWLNALDIEGVEAAEKEFTTSTGRAAEYRPLSLYEEIILR